MGMRARFGFGIARDLKQHMKKFMRYESSCSAAEEKRLYLCFEEVIHDPPPDAITHEFYPGTRFPVRCVNLSYLLSPPSSSSTNKFVQADLKQKPAERSAGFRPLGPRSRVLLSSPGGGSRSFAASPRSRSETKMNITYDEFVPDLRERRGDLMMTRKWGGCFKSGPFLFGGGGSRSAIERSCSLKSKTKVNYPVIKRINKDGIEFLFLDGELRADGQLYSIICDIYDHSNTNLLQVLDSKSKSKSKWVSLGGEGPPGFVGGKTLSSLVCNNKLLLSWYANMEGAYCFDATQPEKGWSSAPPSWGRSIPFLDCEWSFLVEHDHDHLLLFTFGPDFVPNAYTDRSIEVFLMSRQRDTFQSLNQTMRLPEDIDVPCHFWNLIDPPSACSCLHHQFVNLGGSKICLVLHRFFHNDEEYTTLPGSQDPVIVKGKGYIVLITFEYEIKIQSLDFEYNELTVRTLEYTGKHDKKKPDACIKFPGLARAVVL